MGLGLTGYFNATVVEDACREAGISLDDVAVWGHRVYVGAQRLADAGLGAELRSVMERTVSAYHNHGGRDAAEAALLAAARRVGAR